MTFTICNNSDALLPWLGVTLYLLWACAHVLDAWYLQRGPGKIVVLSETPDVLLLTMAVPAAWIASAVGLPCDLQRVVRHVVGFLPLVATAVLALRHRRLRSTLVFGATERTVLRALVDVASSVGLKADLERWSIGTNPAEAVCIRAGSLVDTRRWLVAWTVPSGEDRNPKLHHALVNAMTSERKPATRADVVFCLVAEVVTLIVVGGVATLWLRLYW